MGRTAIVLFVSVVAVLQNPSEAVRFAAHDDGADIPTASRLSKANHYTTTHHSKEWIAAPNGFLYQFHSGEQSWLAAREFCLSQNSDLVILRDKEQIVGLMIPDGPNRDWMYLDGSKYNQSVISWMSGEPFDHTTDGLERCALLRVHARLLDDVDCEASARNSAPVRFVCERTAEGHKKQQLSENFLWRKLEQLLEFFGIGGQSSKPKSANGTDSDEDEDYEDEVTRLNISSSERSAIAKIRFETSSEEEKQVLAVLKKLGLPGSTQNPEEVTNDNDMLVKASTEPKEYTTTPLLSTTDSDQSKESSATPEEKSTVAEETTTTTEAETTATSVESTTSAAETTQATTTNDVSTTEVDKKIEKRTSGEKKDPSPKLHSVPLREIGEREGSGADVERARIEKDPSKVQHSPEEPSTVQQVPEDPAKVQQVTEDPSKGQQELDPEKLEKIINTMEKMVENLEKISVVEKPDAEKEQPEKKEIRKKPQSKEIPQKEAQQKKSKEVHDEESTPKKETKDEAEKADEMEKDFDDNVNKNLPTTDIKPPDEDCEEEGSGEKTTTESMSESVVRNVVDTEDVDDLSQKPKIPLEREEHIQEFLKTLRTFLSRAEHDDLRKLLDDNSGKSLLEKMKLAISAANEREFGRLKELELMKSHGVDISNVPEPKLMADEEREDLFKKISGVVLAEAEKRGLETATEPSARTTTQEASRSTTDEQKEQETVRSSKEYPAGDKKEEEGDKKTEKEIQHDEKTVDNKQREEEKKIEESKVKPETEKVDDSTKNAEEPPQAEKSEPTNTSVEVPARTVQLKEFDNKEEIMSAETLAEREQQLRLEKEAKAKKEEQKVEKVEEKPSEGEVSTEPTTRSQEETTTTTMAPKPKIDGSNSNEGNSNDEDNSFDSNQVERTEARENLEEEIPVTSIPTEDDDDHGVEVGTEKTPEAKAKERRRLQKMTEKKQRKLAKEANEVEKAPDEDDDDSDEHPENPLGLPTLPPPPTFAPLPSLETVLDNLGQQWKKLFPSPKI
ncbi:hypothetical protein Q1695_006521 [Nippostrongylus brasiliensis]|nr:hypothetical protein Q1695_006521 [Nippostrongylus brasiliensis]